MTGMFEGEGLLAWNWQWGVLLAVKYFDGTGFSRKIIKMRHVCFVP